MHGSAALSWPLLSLDTQGPLSQVVPQIETPQSSTYTYKHIIVSIIGLLNDADPTVLPAKSDGDIMFCLHRYQGLIINRSHVCVLILSAG